MVASIGSERIPEIGCFTGVEVSEVFNGLFNEVLIGVIRFSVLLYCI